MRALKRGETEITLKNFYNLGYTYNDIAQMSLSGISYGPVGKAIRDEDNVVLRVAKLATSRPVITYAYITKAVLGFE